MNSVVLIFVALCVFAIGYRFYDLFVAHKILAVNPDRPTPAVKMADGRDYVKHRQIILPLCLKRSLFSLL
jgi:carbon starvation protein